MRCKCKSTLNWTIRDCQMLWSERIEKVVKVKRKQIIQCLFCPLARAAAASLLTSSLTASLSDLCLSFLFYSKSLSIKRPIERSNMQVLASLQIAPLTSQVIFHFSFFTFNSSLLSPLSLFLSVPTALYAPFAPATASLDPISSLLLLPSTAMDESSSFIVMHTIFTCRCVLQSRSDVTEPL